MDFATFNYFASTLVGLNKKLIYLCAFGTDGQESMIKAFSHAFPHFMLKELGIPSSVGDANIFVLGGLGDAFSSSDFSKHLEGCKEALGAMWKTLCA